jgi:hypothetical protein
MWTEPDQQQQEHTVAEQTRILRHAHQLRPTDQDQRTQDRSERAVHRA